MVRPIRLLLVAAVVGAVGLGGSARARACGSNRYSYAGSGAAQRAFGISARIASVDAFTLLHGHTAAWVGVGGPHEGPSGTNEWLQIGLSAFPGVPGSDIYYEDALPSQGPTYHQIAGNVPAGESVDVSLLEIPARPNWWHAWLNGRAVSRPIRLPHSQNLSAPIATAESWDGGTGGACNTFLYHFTGVRIAHSRGGGWRPLSGGFPITSSATRIRRSRAGGAFMNDLRCVVDVEADDEAGAESLVRALECCEIDAAKAVEGATVHVAVNLDADGEPLILPPLVAIEQWLCANRTGSVMVQLDGHRHRVRARA